MCIDKPPELESLRFKTPVRTEQKKQVTIKNPTSTDWMLKPTLDSDSWYGPEKLEVPASQQRTYDVVYRPLVMSENRGGNQDQGSLFFPLPDGSAILYSLFGERESPPTSCLCLPTPPPKKTLMAATRQQYYFVSSPTSRRPTSRLWHHFSLTL